MTLPVSAAAISAADPFGLWQAPAAGIAGAVSFGGLGDSAHASDAPADGVPAAVWSLDLAGALDPGTLEERARQVQAVRRGLEESARRLDVLLAARAAARANPGGLSFAAAEVVALPEAERSLAQALDALDPPAGVAFGLREDLAKLASTDWPALRARLEALFESVNRQLLHFAWVDTSLDGALAARTVVGWSGDLSTCCRPGLSAAQLSTHQRSLELALASRAANLQAIITASQLAAKIALAVTTPLGPIQALALAWEFIYSIVLPMARCPEGGAES